VANATEEKIVTICHNPIYYGFCISPDFSGFPIAVEGYNVKRTDDFPVE